MEHNLKKSTVSLSRIDCAVLGSVLERVCDRVELSFAETMVLEELSGRIKIILSSSFAEEND